MRFQSTPSPLCVHGGASLTRHSTGTKEQHVENKSFGHDCRAGAGYNCYFLIEHTYDLVQITVVNATGCGSYVIDVSSKDKEYFNRVRSERLPVYINNNLGFV